ncbi:AAA family ATPase [Xanthomonas arboricola]|uniref:AAA family ATPase n=1 Tax=Xanthomonas arboricola TaxID=56448 RepID=UPI001FD6F52D|nr:AAA family ATPase [Xanthomonas arboricola]UOS97412.1 AAA family ATPase [Xanthomonas arboricola]
MSILVDSVRVAAFGGIRTSLELDLSAPLTIIYAPNGTGKTSIIESIDWLLGGEVREERCKIASDHETTEVILGGTVASKPLSAKKSLRSNGKTLRITNGVSVGEADFLQALAPDCDVSELSALSRIPRLKAFLSSNRVLGIDSLSRLIDGDNADARADAMADLTGTRAQRNAQKMVEIYRRKLSEKLSKLRDDLNDLHSRQQEYLNLSITRADADALIAEAMRILSATETMVGLPHAELTVRANSELDQINSRIATLEKLRELLSVPPNDLELGALRASIASMEAEIRQANKALEDQAEQFQILGREVSQLTRDADGMQIIVDALLDLQANTSADTTFRTLLADKDSVSFLFSDFDAAANELSSLASAVSQSSVDHETRKHIDARILAIQQERSDLAPREKLEMDLAGKQREAAHSRASRESLRTLKNEAVRASLLAHQHFENGSNCPACGHDWGSHEKLGAALNWALASLPQTEALLLSHETALSAEIELLKEQLDHANGLGKQLIQATYDLDRINKRIAEAGLLAGRFGFATVGEVRDSDISELQRRLRSASAFSAFERARSASHITYLPPSNHTPRQQIRDLSSSAASLRAGAAEKQLHAEEVSMAMAVGESRLSKLAAQLAKLRDRHTEAETWKRRTNRIQGVLGLNSPSIQHLDEIESSLLHRHDQVQTALRHLDVVGEIQTKTVLAQRAELASQQAEAVARDISTVEHELSRISQLNDRIESQSECYRKRLIETVGPSVSQLFQRMQVNRVFNSVSVGPSFELKGLLEEHSIEPEVFSAGQRQDLALAFFLVRAYTLGGSFFLDEPLAHLDDLNRVAVLDTLRAFVLSGQQQPHQQTRLVLTTASWTTTRHVIQKFMRINRKAPLLRAYQLTGNVSSSVGRVELFPTPLPGHSH